MFTVVAQLPGDIGSTGLTACWGDEGGIRRGQRKPNEETASGENRFFIPAAIVSCG